MLRHPAAECHGKRVYHTWAAARRSARATHRNRDEAVKPYRCHICGRFHVGAADPWTPHRHPQEAA